MMGVGMIGVVGSANIEVFKSLLKASLGDETPYNETLKWIETRLKGIVSEEERTKVLLNILSTITTQFTAQAMESSRGLALEDLLFDIKKEQTQVGIDKERANIKLIDAQIELTHAQKEQIDTEIQLNIAKKELTQAQTKQAIKQLDLIDQEIEKSKAQIELAKAEIDFNTARTALVNAQSISESEKTKNIKRERYALDDQLRIKEAEYISNSCFGYAAGGVNVPEQLMQTMLNKINAVTTNATKVI